MFELVFALLEVVFELCAEFVFDIWFEFIDELFIEPVFPVLATGVDVAIGVGDVVTYPVLLLLALRRFALPSVVVHPARAPEIISAKLKVMVFLIRYFLFL